MMLIPVEVEVSNDFKTLGLVQLIHSDLPLLFIFQAGLYINLFLPFQVSFFEEDKSENSTAEIVGTQINKFIHQIFM